MTSSNAVYADDSPLMHYQRTLSRPHLAHCLLYSEQLPSNILHQKEGDFLGWFNQLDLEISELIKAQLTFWINQNVSITGKLSVGLCFRVIWSQGERTNRVCLFGILFVFDNVAHLAKYN